MGKYWGKTAEDSGKFWGSLLYNAKENSFCHFSKNFYLDFVQCLSAFAAHSKNFFKKFSKKVLTSESLVIYDVTIASDSLAERRKKDGAEKERFQNV